MLRNICFTNRINWVLQQSHTFHELEMLPPQKAHNRFCLEEGGRVERRWVETGGKNDPNDVCTCE
jgi:hypothetical protein